jgi:hypothetical protein
LSNALKFGSHGGFRILTYNWDPAITALARGDDDWDLPEQSHTQAFGFPFAAARTKNVVPLVV